MSRLYRCQCGPRVAHRCLERVSQVRDIGARRVLPSHRRMSARFTRRPMENRDVTSHVSFVTIISCLSTMTSKNKMRLILQAARTTVEAIERNGFKCMLVGPIAAYLHGSKSLPEVRTIFTTK